MNTCYGFLHNRLDAEDAGQEVFLKAWKALPDFRWDSQPSTWLYRIAVRTCLDILKQRRRQRRWAVVLSWVGLRERPPVALSAKDPFVEVEHRERAAALMRAMESLPEGQYAAYALATFEGMTAAQIAAVLQTTTSAVESALHRARANLRKTLESYHVVAASHPSMREPKEDSRDRE